MGYVRQIAGDKVIMKILFLGDSITDAMRNREDAPLFKYGQGYVRQVAGELLYENPQKYEIINRGVSGERVVDLYARVKKDVWNLQPDVLNILVGVNEVWHEHFFQNGVDLERYEKVYCMLIEDTLKVLPNVKIIICEPFVLPGLVPDRDWEMFKGVYEYAKVARRVADKYNLPFVALQDKLNEYASKFGNELTLHDGVHPDVAGATVIAKEWLKVFRNKIDK